MNTTRCTPSRRGLIAGAALCASLLVPTAVHAQNAPGNAPPLSPAKPVLPGAATAPVAPAGGLPPGDAAAIDPAEAPQVASLLRDEAVHRDRLARIRRLRELAQQSGQRDRLAQLDDLERREFTRHEARVLSERSQLSDRTARGYDDVVRRSGDFRVRGRDISAARRRLDGSSGSDTASRRAGSPERTPPRTTRSAPPPASRAPTRAPSRGGGPRR